MFICCFQTWKAFRFCTLGGDNYSPILLHNRTQGSKWEERETMTMCGCFWLTSEAHYEYSAGAHCAPMLCRTQHACNGEAWLNFSILFLSHMCAWVTRVGLHLWMNIESVSLAGNCTDNMCWEEFFRCEPYFPRRGFCVWIPAGRLSDTCAVRRSHQLCHEPKQNHHGECSTGSTRAFFSSSKSRPSDKIYNKSDSCK